MATWVTRRSRSQSDSSRSFRVVVPNVLVSWDSGVITQATTDFLCTSSPQHLSCTTRISLLLRLAGRWVAVHLKTLLFVLTAAAGQHSYMPVSHPGRFPHGLAAPMTTALVVPSGILPFSFLLCGLRKAMVIPGRGPLSPLTLSAAERSRSLLPFRIVERLCKDPDLYFVL